MKPSSKPYQSIKQSLGCLILLLPFAFFLPTNAIASPPSLYAAEYDARYRGLRARAEMTLEARADNQFELSSMIILKILGKSVSSITEQGVFSWEANRVKPINYQFIQKGLGKRSRSVEYDWFNGVTRTVVNEEETEFKLERALFDELSMYLEIKRQISAGIDDIYLDVVDENLIKEYHYQVIGEEKLETPLGLFDAIKLERVRDPDSKRVTELWFAKDWENLLLKLYQEDSNGKVFQLNLRQAKLGENILTPLQP